MSTKGLLQLSDWNAITSRAFHYGRLAKTLKGRSATGVYAARIELNNYNQISHYSSAFDRPQRNNPTEIK